MAELVVFNINAVGRETILEMVKEEQVVRYSKGIQEAYTIQFIASSTVVNIEREIQQFILRKFGFKDDIESLEQYWKIPSTYWNDAEIKGSIFYMKLNIFQFPKLNVNDNMVDIGLVDYSTNRSVSLRSLETPHRPLIILAGSMT
jgi:hypothetical protein